MTDTHPSGEVVVQLTHNGSLSRNEHGASFDPAINLSKQQSQAFDDTFKEQPVSITFKNVVYTVKVARKQFKEILSDVSGFFAPRSFTAIMGPSGSGKTTLMDILTQRKNTGKVTGDVKLNGQPITRKVATSTISYVEQANVLLEALTVTEMLNYTAALYWPWKPRAFRKELVDSMIDTLGLSKIRNSKIGGAMVRGISGGEARRTFIAVALLGGPRVLLLDEPTSGLDSFMAKEVMTFMKALVVDRGLTVVTTIHQPSTAIFNLFDKLLLILRGKCVFFGPVELVTTIFPSVTASDPATGTDARLLAKHAQDGNSAESNLAENVMDYICNAEKQKMELDLARLYEGSKLKANNEQELQALLDSTAGSKGTVEMASARQGTKWYQFSIVGQLKALLSYRLLAQLKHPVWVMTRLMSYVVLTIFLFSIYWGVADNTDFKSFTDTNSVIFLVAFITTFNCISFLPDLVSERPVFYHENDAGLYTSFAYLVSKTVLEGVFTVVLVLFSILCLWFAIQLQGSFVLMSLTVIVTISCALQIVFMGAALGPTADMANMIVMMLFVVLVYTTGFYIQWDSIPWYWRWSGYINFLRYSYSALLINQYQDSTIVIGTGADAQTALEYLSLDGKNKWAMFGYLCIFYPVFFCLAWLATARVRHVQR